MTHYIFLNSDIATSVEITMEMSKYQTPHAYVTTTAIETETGCIGIPLYIDISNMAKVIIRNLAYADMTCNVTA